MAQVALVQQRQAQARVGTLDGQGQQELKDLKTDLAIAEGVFARSITAYAVVVCSAQRPHINPTERLKHTNSRVVCVL